MPQLRTAQARVSTELACASLQAVSQQSLEECFLVPGPGGADPRDSYDPSPFPLHQCTPEPCGCLFAPTDRCLFAPTLSSDGVFAARQLGCQERLSPNKSKEERQGTGAGGCLDRQKTDGSRDSRLTRSRSWAICHWQERLNGNFNKLLEPQWRRA